MTYDPLFLEVLPVQRARGSLERPPHVFLQLLVLNA